MVTLKIEITDYNTAALAEALEYILPQIKNGWQGNEKQRDDKKSRYQWQVSGEEELKQLSIFEL